MVRIAIKPLEKITGKTLWFFINFEYARNWIFQQLSYLKLRYFINISANQFLVPC